MQHCHHRTYTGTGAILQLQRTPILFLVAVTIAVSFIVELEELQVRVPSSHAFVLHPNLSARSRPRSRSRSHSHAPTSSTCISMSNKDSVDEDISTLNRRLHIIRTKILTQQASLPPNNPHLSPTQFVSSILGQLRRSGSGIGKEQHDGDGDGDGDGDDIDYSISISGIRTLVRSSSKGWRDKLRESIGAPPTTATGTASSEDGSGNRNARRAPRPSSKIQVTEDVLVEALERAMSRPNNQYQILVQDRYGNVNGNYDDDNDDNDGTHNSNSPTGTPTPTPSYTLHFPSDVIDYSDGKCWLEAQLRDPISNKLLVMTGWSLVKENEFEYTEGNGNGNGSNSMGMGTGMSGSTSSGGWLLDRLDWQDFRDEFRPGIGREEWMRICG
jgi:hypothetical protein